MATQDPTDDPGEVRRDVGGWISGPMIPPGSTPCRELLRVIGTALDMPEGRAEHDRERRGQLLSARCEVIRGALRRVLADPGADALDMMTEATAIADRMGDYEVDYSTGGPGMIP